MSGHACKPAPHAVQGPARAGAALASDAVGRSVGLPVLTPSKPRSRMGPWRAGVLVLVHLLIIAHVAIWVIASMRQPDGTAATLSPLEPSEAMFTLDEGVVNAGFVLFVAAIAATALLGRFFCGWACHVVALQDLCAWLMNRLGVRPKPFRSRLLLWVPLGLAVYMFVWPTFRRLVLAPLLTAWLGEVPSWVGTVVPWTGLRAGLVVEDFWRTFPPWWVAVPFLLVCGFATVYFLGSKGFCTYGCPYGGFFGPVDRLAPVRIRVTDACRHCGHCTSVCTSNVRVHEEVRDFGAVVDPGCMKCLDCVSACPSGALYVGWGAPAVAIAPRAPETAARAAQSRQRRYDLTWPEELAIAGVFLVLLRGFWGSSLGGAETMPLLMAVGVAGVGAFMAHRLWRMVREANVRGPYRQLKLRGRVTGAGWVFALLTASVLVLGAAGAGAWVNRWQADLIYDRLVRSETAGGGRALGPGYAPTESDLSAARRAIAMFTRAGAVAEGGLWLHQSWVNRVRLANLHAMAGEPAAAARQLEAALAARGRDDLWVNLAELRALSGAPAAEIRRAMLGAATHPGALVRSVSSIMRARGYGVDDARLVLTGLTPPAVEEVAGISDAMRAQAERMAPAARAEALGRIEAMLRAELERQPRAEGLRFRLAEAIVAASPARLPEADALYDAAVRQFPQDPGVLANAAQVRLLTGRPRQALELLDAALAKASVAEAGAGGGVARSSIVHQQRAAALLGVGRPAEALQAIALASDLDPGNREVVRRLIELADALGQQEVARAARDRQARQSQPPPPSDQRPPEAGTRGLDPAQRRERTNQP